jgi:TRAP-type C4-dicarboxylate transport system permease small subunit
MEKVTHFLRQVFWILNIVGGCALVGMMLLTTADVILRSMGKPILGCYELVGFLGAIAITLPFAQTTIERAHVAVQLLVIRLSIRGRKVVFIITSILSLYLFSMIAFESVRYGTDVRLSGEVSMTLHVPFWPILYAIGVCAAIVCVICLIDLLLTLMNRMKPWQPWKG